tara:strand:+ start:1680 stop:2237 length:558 start_codon:yes stop_codon:yes gene_type:complete
MISFKKAAMFGLDARIALAIFGALSVISGAALYSAIQDSKITQMVTQLQEVSKAYESYYLDVGSHLSVYNPTSLSAEYLIDKPTGVNNWNGPYINADYTAATIRNLSDNFGHAFIKIGDIDKSWTASSGCTSICYVWVEINGTGNPLPIDVVEKLDLKVDGDSDLTTGRLRGYSQHAYFAIMPYE